MCGDLAHGEMAQDWMEDQVKYIRNMLDSISLDKKKQKKPKTTQPPHQPEDAEARAQRLQAEVEQIRAEWEAPGTVDRYRNSMFNDPELDISFDVDNGANIPVPSTSVRQPDVAGRRVGGATRQPSADDGEVAGPSNAVPFAKPPLRPLTADDGQIAGPSGLGKISPSHKTNISNESNSFSMRW